MRLATEANDNFRDVTYLGLRLGTVIVTFMLGLAVLLQIGRSEWCIKGSLSSYFYTPVGLVFGGALCAIGASLIMYRGKTDVENVFLDFSGFVAFIVAFVPTTPENSCPKLEEALAAPEVDYGIRLIALLVAGAVAVVAGSLLWTDGSPGMSRATRWSIVASILGLFVTALFFTFGGEIAEEHGHGFAASVLFIGIAAVVLHNAYEHSKNDLEMTDQGFKWVALRNFWRNRYGGIFLVMLLGVVVAIVMKVLEAAITVFVLEVWIIVVFAFFWWRQTKELRGKPSPTSTG